MVLGGVFLDAGDVPADHLAAIDAEGTWYAIGGGVQESPRYPAVYALATYAGKLIVAGDFFRVGGNDPDLGTAANCIAAWDGAAWDTLADGIYNPVYALTIYDGKLIAGGDFQAAGGGVRALDLAAWDGTAWSAVGGGTVSGPGEVTALLVYNGQLIVGGDFTAVGGGTVPASCIAAWDGAAWTALGSGFTNQRDKPSIRALAAFGGRLIAAGRFLTAGGVDANMIAAWDGAAWAPLGSGLGGVVQALAVVDGLLTAGGIYAYAGGIETHDLAQWDGAAWRGIGFTGWDDDSGVYSLLVRG